MATNNFLPFCETDTGTNLPTQGDYAVDPNRDIGNQPGIASSKLNNKAIRQATAIMSQIAQYASDKMNTNILDDGNLANVLALFNSAFAPLDQYNIENLTLAFSVGASAATIAVKTQAGTDPSTTDRIYVGMRSATLTSGVFNRRTITGALSVTLSSGSTLGQVDGQASRIWVYLIDNAGTLELAVSHSKYPENELVTTTAEGGGGGADSATAIYSTTARSNVPIRLIGYILNTQTTAGTWAATATQIQLAPFQRGPAMTVTRLTSGSGATYNTPAGCTRIRVLAIGGGGGGGSSGNTPGTAGTAGGNTIFGTSLIQANGGGFGAQGGAQVTSGGAITCNSPAINVSSVVGNYGSGSAGFGDASSASPGGQGGSTRLWTSTIGQPATNGFDAPANTGAGGSGSGANGAVSSGSGGQAGGQVDAWIINPLASYTYTIGAGGNGQAVSGEGGSARRGGNGGSGIIIIEEYYD